MVNEFPKISIITPSYNQGEFIEETILSILNQEYPNLEYIIIDGGSTDNSIEIIRKYEDRLAYWISERDAGTYDANNKGLKRVTGDYWCIVNSDDLLLPGTLKKISAAIAEHPTEKWICGGVKYIDQNGHVTGTDMPVKRAAVEGLTFLSGCWISHPTVFLHKDVIDKIGFFNKYHLMDLNYWLRMEKASFAPFVVPDYLSALRIHKDCKSANVIKFNQEFIKVYVDFVVANKLSKRKPVRRNLRSYQAHLNQLLLSKEMIEGNKLATLSLLYKTTLLKPPVILSKWYWGTLKRLVFGISPNDPLRDFLDDKDSKAQWEMVN